MSWGAWFVVWVVLTIAFAYADTVGCWLGWHGWRYSIASSNWRRCRSCARVEHCIGGDCWLEMDPRDAPTAGWMED